MIYKKGVFNNFVKYNLQRELRLLDNIKDHNPKYLLTTDYTPYASHNGIKQINVFN